MSVCPSLSLMSVPSDQSSADQTFLSFAGVKQRESLEWPLTRMTPLGCSSGEWPSWGILMVFLSMLTWDCVCWLNKMRSESLDYSWASLDYPWTMRDLVSPYPCTVLEALPDLCRCRISRISRVRICLPFMSPNVGPCSPLFSILAYWEIGCSPVCRIYLPFLAPNKGQPTPF